MSRRVDQGRRWKFVICGLVGFLSMRFLSAAPVRAQEPAPRFEPSACPVKVPADAEIECGTLIVPEDYQTLQGSQVRLPVIIIRSQEGASSGQALLFTEGGPGYTSLNSIGWLAGTSFLKHGDIVILEQRGNIHAQPSLACDVSVWWDEKPGHTPCLDGLREAGIDLSNYTSTASAADIKALMGALDYEAWNLYGTSYSTRVMQLVMQHNPERVRSVVLHSASPISESRFQHDPQHSMRALKVMFTDCASDPECALAYPDLEQTFYELIRQLNREPIDLQMTLSQTKERITYRVNGATLIDWMVGSAFYKPAFSPYPTAYAPLLIDGLSRGNWDLLYPWAKPHLDRYADPSFAWGMYLSVNCQEEAPLAASGFISTQERAYPDLDDYLRYADELAICQAWNLPSGPPMDIAPVESDIPTLALGGTYDPVTPPEWSRTAVSGLSEATFVEFPSAGHSVLTDNPCAENLVSAFLENPRQELDTSCLADGRQTAFTLPGEIILAPDLYEVHYGEIGYSQGEQALFMGSLMALAVLTGLVWVAGLIQWARGSKGNRPDRLARLAGLMTGILTLAAWGWSYTLRSTLRETAAAAPVALRFGLPGEYWWLFALAILIALLTLGLALIVVAIWRRGDGSLLGRLLYSGVALSAGLFSGMLASWGFLTALFR
jgi:pimeloyl-ACP methyl ester carboxylesterase